MTNCEAASKKLAMTTRSNKTEQSEGIKMKVSSNFAKSVAKLDLDCTKLGLTLVSGVVVETFLFYIGDTRTSLMVITIITSLNQIS